MASKRCNPAEDTSNSPSRVLLLETVNRRNGQKDSHWFIRLTTLALIMSRCSDRVYFITSLVCNHFFFFFPSFSHQIMGLHHYQRLPFLKAIMKRQYHLVLGRLPSTSLPVSNIYPVQFLSSW